MKKIFSSVYLLLPVLLFITCDKQPSLQSYFVEKLEDPSFLIVNIPFQLENIFSENLTQEELKAVSNIGKLNLLVYRPKENQVQLLKKELKTVEQLLENKRYQNLMEFKAFDKGQGSFLFEGETDQIEEGIVFVSIPGSGFGLLRILGSDINPLVLSKLIKKIDLSLLEKEITATRSGLSSLL